MATDAEKLESGVERGLLAFEASPCAACPGLPHGFIVAVPGPKGHRRYIYNIKNRLKAAGFRFDGEARVWFRACATAQRRAA
jgi:hypothetical protein